MEPRVTSRESRAASRESRAASRESRAASREARGARHETRGTRWKSRVATCARHELPPSRSRQVASRKPQEFLEFRDCYLSSAVGDISRAEPAAFVSAAAAVLADAAQPWQRREAFPLVLVTCRR